MGLDLPMHPRIGEREVEKAVRFLNPYVIGIETGGLLGKAAEDGGRRTEGVIFDLRFGDRPGWAIENRKCERAGGV